MDDLLRRVVSMLRAEGPSNFSACAHRAIEAAIPRVHRGCLGGSKMARIVSLSFIIVLLASNARAGVPVPWTPENAGVLWYQPNDSAYPLDPPRQPPGEATDAWWLTRRIAAHPRLPGVMHLGSFFNGLYGIGPGGAWANLTPGCLLPVNKPRDFPGDAGIYDYARRVAIAITGLDACGIEGIAYDPLIPGRMYVAAYDVTKLVGTEPALGDGGVYRSDDFGLGWTKLAGGFRGNGLAVARSGTGPATLVAGHIQSSNAAVGATPGNGSLSISRDDGRTWSAMSLPPSGCADSPMSSQRITPTIAIVPGDPRTIFAGTNAGLCVSTDAGATFSLAKVACGGVWGVAVSSDGSKVVIGDKDGVISASAVRSIAFTPVADLGDGKIQTVLLDPRDERVAYAALWSGRDANVMRIQMDGSARVTHLEDSLLRDIIPVEQAWPPGIPRPFPLTFNDATGAPAPSLFLTMQAPPSAPTGALHVSTIFRGAFVRGD